MKPMYAEVRAILNLSEKWAANYSKKELQEYLEDRLTSSHGFMSGLGFRVDGIESLDVKVRVRKPA